MGTLGFGCKVRSAFVNEVFTISVFVILPSFTWGCLWLVSYKFWPVSARTVQNHTLAANCMESCQMLQFSLSSTSFWATVNKKEKESRIMSHKSFSGPGWGKRFRKCPLLPYYWWPVWTDHWILFCVAPARCESLLTKVSLISW